MKELDFRKEIIYSAEVLGVHVVDLPDELKRVLPILPVVWRKRLARMIIKKPYDLAFLHKGKYYPCELKFEKTNFTFNLSKIEKHQIDGLTLTETCGGFPFLLINFKKTLTTPQQVRYNIPMRLLNVVYCVKISLLNKWISLGKKSLNLKILDEEAVKLSFHPKKKIWELNELWEK